MTAFVSSDSAQAGANFEATKQAAEFVMRSGQQVFSDVTEKVEGASQHWDVSFQTLTQLSGSLDDGTPQVAHHSTRLPETRYH
jgi:hypothetical protein